MYNVETLRMTDKNLEKENQLKRKNASLTHTEWMTFFFLPFFTPKHKYRNDHYSQSELERFKEYGFEKKIIEAEKTKRSGIIFWLVVITVTAFTFVYYD